MGAVLVTGSAGLLGKAVAERLVAAGRAVVGLDPAGGAGAPWPTVADDLSSRAAIDALLRENAVTAIVHAGGVSGPTVRADDPAGIMRTNVAGSLDLLFAALEAGVERFLYCSSLSAVGDIVGEEPAPDDLPPRPTTAYGASKAAMDMVLTGLWRRVPMDLVSLRYTGIYGPARRTSFLVDDLVDAALAGRPVAVPRQEAVPYVYVDDAAAATVAALASDGRRQLFYAIAHPQRVATAELAGHVSDVAGPLDWREDPTLPPLRRGAVSIEAARRDFDFRPRIDIREGVRRTVEGRRAPAE